MEKVSEEDLNNIVALYFDGYNVKEAIKKVIKKEPFTEGPRVNN